MNAAPITRCRLHSRRWRRIDAAMNVRATMLTRSGNARTQCSESPSVQAAIAFTGTCSFAGRPATTARIPRSIRTRTLTPSSAPARPRAWPVSGVQAAPERRCPRPIEHPRAVLGAGRLPVRTRVLSCARHVPPNDPGWKPSEWIEESLCETASQFALRSMARSWAIALPYGAWVT
jgi:hypothetical protein